MNECVVGETYTALLGGPKGAPEDIVLTACTVRIAYEAPGGDEVAYLQEEGAPSIDLVTPTWEHKADGRFAFSFSPDKPVAAGSTGYWYYTIDTPAWSAHERILVRSEAVVPEASIPVPTVYLNRVKELVQDNCAVPSIAVINKATDGSLAAGQVNIRVSSLTKYGETLACERVTVTAVQDDALEVRITRVPEATGFRVYASVGANAETLQGEVSVAQTALTTFTIEALAAGSALPTANTGSIMLSTSAYVTAINSAVQHDYSPLRPVESNSTQALTSGTYEYTLPVNWEQGFSMLRRFQYPSAGTPPEYHDRDKIYVKDGKWGFDVNPSTGQLATLYFTTRHIVSDLVNTVPTADLETVCLLAAARACDEIAVKYSHLSNSSIGADSTDYKLRADDFRKNGREFRKMVWKALGVSDSGIKAESDFMSWDYYPDHGRRVTI